MDNYPDKDGKSTKYCPSRKIVRYHSRYIDGVHTTTKFKLIEIVDDNNPYLALLGLDWSFDNMAIINFKKRKIIFEINNMRFIVPLDPSEGARYTELVREEYNADKIDNNYQIIAKE